jgi:hypothetical protein
LDSLFVDTAAGTVPAPAATTPVVVLPPNTPDMNQMWKVLNTYASELSIMWSDGSTDPADKTRLKWYGVNCNHNSDGTCTWDTFSVKDSNWANNTSASGKPEFSVGGKYRVLFCHDEPSSWPAAIKIRFKLTDPDAPTSFDLGNHNGMYYEVICPLGQ